MAALAAAAALRAATALAADPFARPIVYSVPGMERVQVERDLLYRGTATGGQKMDVYVPPGLGPNDRRPVVFFVHGGPVTPEMHPKDWS